MGHASSLDLTDSSVAYPVFIRAFIYKFPFVGTGRWKLGQCIAARRNGGGNKAAYGSKKKLFFCLYALR